MAGDLEPAGGPSALVRSVTAVVLSLAGAGYAGAGGAVAAAVLAGAVPYAERLGAFVSAELRGKPQLLSEGILVGARDIDPDVTEEDLGDLLIEDDELRALTVRVVEAVRRTGRSDKVRWLGEVLGRAAADGEQIDHARVVAAALDDLEAPQIIVLRKLTEPSPTELRSANGMGWLGAHVVEHLPSLDEGSVRSSLGTIVRHGMGRAYSGFDGADLYQVTAFGHAVLAVIDRDRPAPAV